MRAITDGGGRPGRSWIRRATGLLIATFGVIVLYGGLFVPWDVIVEEPRIVPAPESWVAWWIIAMGLLLALWPARRRRGASV